MIDIDGAEDYDPEDLFAGYLLGRKDASVKAQDILSCGAYDELNDFEAAKDLENRMHRAAKAIRAARKAKDES
jgi:hypothetical protein